MTEVFIAALSTTKFEMNEEDMEFYRDEKAREIQEVRAAMEQLHEFAQLHKKERPMANHAQLWKNLLILSKILGFEAEFTLVDQLRIPQAILTQELWQLNDPFTLRHYYPRTPIGQWETTSDRYFILMEGIVEKEIIRSSISKFDAEMELGLSKGISNSKFRKNNKRRFARTDQQIPICLNSKRSEGRNPQVMAGNFRSLTDVQMLEVSSSSWKRYVGDFKKLQEEYLMNFIRKKLNISLNYQEKVVKNEGEEVVQDPFYSLVTLQRKSVLEFAESEILLLYMGEMLVTTNNYKIEVSRGCVLNPAIHEAFRDVGQAARMGGNAVAKSLSTVIKISIGKLQNYLKVVEEEREELVELLRGLQEGRRSKKDEDKMITIRPVETSLASLKHSKMMNKLYNAQQIQCQSRPSCLSPSKLKKECDSSRIRCKDRVIGIKSIENMVQKTVKAAQLKHIQYLKKAHLTEDSNVRFHNQENTVPQSIFKDCMRNIHNKNELLKQAVRVQREKLKNEFGQRQKMLNVQVRNESASKGKTMPLVDGSIYIRKRMKDIYVRTQGSQEMIAFTSSQRTSISPLAKTPSRETVGSSLQMRDFTDKQLYTGYYKWFSGGLGVMKKVPTGKIRRIKVK